MGPWQTFKPNWAIIQVNKKLEEIENTWIQNQSYQSNRYRQLFQLCCLFYD